MGPKFGDLEKESWEQKVYKGNQIIETIKLQADFFEMKTRLQPTIFLSYDLFALVAATGNVIVHRVDKNQPAHTICGYDLEIIYHGTDLLYLGHKVCAPF